MQIPALSLTVTEMEQCRPTRSGECRAPACKFDRFNLRNRDVLEFEIMKRDSRQEIARQMPSRDGNYSDGRAPDTPDCAFPIAWLAVGDLEAASLIARHDAGTACTCQLR